MKNYCYIYLLAACMAPMSLQAKKAIPYSGEVCIAPLPTVPTPLPGISSDSYAQRFADSEMLRFPKAYQLDHGKRLFFGYSQGVGCCAMLDMWKNTGDKRYFTYVEEWADKMCIRDSITHGSTVTYKVHSFRYFPPNVLAAAVTACISA